MKSALNSAGKKAHNMVEKADEAVSSFSMNDLREAIEGALESVRDNGRVAADRAETWVKANPYKALFGAVTAGAIIASFMRRGKR
ncbi:MAG TPA: hypothetical protein PL182_12720 [Pseudobdellovibrionaceae bacterium]|nr:hypothetical protein [Pseudobdellovibrionaceae bacterium]